LRSLPAFFLAALPQAALAASAPQPPGFLCGTHADLLLEQRHRHRQNRLRNADALTAEGARAPLPDIGNIAILDDSEGAVIRPNLFDLKQRTIRFSPSGATADRYSASNEALQFDATGAERGSPLAGLQDDDFREIRLPFAFPFFGSRYESLFVNSDGNLSFTAGDRAISSRNLSRAVGGPPRIFPFFADLDPAQPESAVRYYGAPDRAVFTWDRVPQYAARGIGPRQKFQAVLYAEGRIEFHYLDITINEAVVGIAPGHLRNDVAAADFSAGFPSPGAGAIAEIFSSVTDVDVTVVTRKFFRNHDDSYDYLVLFNNMGLPAGPGAFAFLMHIRNRVQGIGTLLREGPIFDNGAEFGSPARLQAFLNLGPIANYPANPGQVIPVFASSGNTALTILGQEAGHRFLAYPRFLDPANNRPSIALLGRDNAHWSFFFNSDASVVEGNRIEDRGAAQSPRFRTTATVQRYSALDQYLMGLRPASETPPSFLVRNPTLGFASDSPRAGVEFDGVRQDITVEMIIAAEGRRVPDSSVSQKHFNYAFALLIREGTQPSAEDLGQLERMRTEWERFFAAAVDNRGSARTSLARQLRLSTWPAGGVMRGSTAPATVSIGSPLSTPLMVNLATDAGLLAVPSSVTIAAGSTSAAFSISGLRAGVAELTARVADSAYDVSRTLVQVRDDASQLRWEVLSGNNQRGGRGSPLAEPILLRLWDENETPYAGVPVTFTVSGDGAATPPRATTDAEGRVRVSWRLATSGGNTLRAAVDGAPGVSAQVTATALDRPAFSAAGVVQAATFNTAVSPGGLGTIFGVALAAESSAASTLPLPASLSSTSVTVNGQAAPLLYVSPSQVNFQVPFEITGSTAEVVVTTAAGASAAVRIPVAAVQPGIFYNTTSGLGAIVHNRDGAPTSQRPARPGDFLQVYATGLGAVLPTVLSGFPAPVSPLAVTLRQPQVTIAGLPAPVAFSGLAPGFAGLYQLTVQVPDGVASGRQPVVLTVSGARSNEAFVFLENGVQ
jgi:uncharacterized protein (TIGR03437 family)